MLHINDLTYRIEGRPLFEQATLAIQQGQKIGLVGRNGTGKSTLFRLIKGEISPDDGSVNLRRGARLGVVDQEVPSGPESLLDTVLAADTERTKLLAEAETATDAVRIAEIHTRLGDIDAYTAEARAAMILSGLGFDSDQQQQACAEFSGGWRMRVALAAMLFAEPDLLLLDEPTNYLDVEGAVWLEAHIRHYPGTALIISHDRDFLNHAVTDIAHLRTRKLFSYSGGYDNFERQLREQQRLSMALRDKQEDERRKLEAFVTRFRAKASKAKQAQSRVKRLEKMRPVATIIDDPIPPILLPSPERSLSPPIIRFDNAVLGYETDTPVLKNLNPRIDPDDRIGLLGKNGEGKSTFAKAVIGALAPQDGNIWRHKKMEIGYFAQHEIDALNPAKNAYDHVVALMPDATEAERRARLAQFGLGHEKVETPAGNLSGGEKARLLFSLISFNAPHLLVLDEPANHLDMDSRSELIKAINSYDGAVLIISHDRNLLESVVDRLWIVENGSVTSFDGTLDAYRAAQIEKSSPTKSATNTTESAAKIARKESAEARKRLAPLKTKCNALEAEIERLRKGMDKIDRELSDPTIYSDNPKRAQILTQLRGETDKQVLELEDAWLAALDDYETAKSAEDAA